MRKKNPGRCASGPSVRAAAEAAEALRDGARGTQLRYERLQCSYSWKCQGKV